TGMVSVDCGDRIDGLCDSHAVDRETLWYFLETRTVILEGSLYWSPRPINMHVAAQPSARVHITRGRPL
ncbi:MAG TPA: hypothetical protein VFR82_02860, partial [Nitrospira sp.]|nr:hypothetical protein [Nitrospira sp.]